MQVEKQDYKAEFLNPRYLTVVIPKNWNVVGLKDLVIKHNAGIFKNQDSYGSGSNIVGVADLYTNNSIDGQIFKWVSLAEGEKTEHRLKEGDIVYAESSLVRGGIGKALIVTKAGEGTIFAWHTRRITLNDLAVPMFVYYALNLNIIRNSIINRSTTTALTGIPTKDYFATKIPLPAKGEQRKIAFILSKEDKLIQKIDQIIVQTQTLKKFLIRKLLSKGIGHTKFKKTATGEIPEEWQVVKVSEVSSEFIGGGTPSTRNPDYWNGDIHWMRSASIKGRYITAGEKFISKLGLDNSATHIVSKNNLVIATRVSIGNVAVNKIDVAISQDLTGIIIDRSKACIEYIYWVFLTLEDTIKSFTQGTTIKGLTRDVLRNIDIALPSLDEQQKIASILSNIDNNIQKQQTYKLLIEDLKKGLMEKLLTGKIRVKV